MPLGARIASAGCVNGPNVSGSVDNGEIRYQNNATIPEINAAISSWNAVGKIQIRPDGATTINDLNFYDANRSDVPWSGLWTPRTGEDTIHINRYYTNAYSSGKRKGVVAHEVGHALRLGHFNNTAALMHCEDTRTVYAPASADKTRYYAIWGK